MTKSAALLLGTTAVLAVAVAGSASAAGQRAGLVSRGKVAHQIITGKHKTLYDQNANDTGFGILSQNFESTLDAYDSQGADDFIVPGGQTWTVKQVDVTGNYFGGGVGPAASENVFFYRDAGGLPGALKAEIDGVVGADTAGSFVIHLGTPVKLKGGNTVHGKRYWISVQANLDSTGGSWAWETNGLQNGDPAAWQNPGNGFYTGCTVWGVMTSCIGSVGQGPDFMFALKGSHTFK